jgi:hypothetical protein
LIFFHPVKTPNVYPHNIHTFIRPTQWTHSVKHLRMCKIPKFKIVEFFVVNFICVRLFAVGNYYAIDCLHLTSSWRHVHVRIWVSWTKEIRLCLIFFHPVKTPNVYPHNIHTFIRPTQWTHSVKHLRMCKIVCFIDNTWVALLIFLSEKTDMKFIILVTNLKEISPSVQQ